MTLHQPVLLSEAIAGLNIKQDGTYVDATFGRGGHSLAILQSLGPEGRLISLDKDPAAVDTARMGPYRDPRFTIEHTSFANLATVAAQHDCTGKVDGILFDLGVSSPQLDQAERGFSFMRDGPLDMRMDSSQGMTAAEWLAQTDESEIINVLRLYGEEPRARRIAQAIVNTRTECPLRRTLELATLIEKTVGRRPQEKKHPATRTFQAIRMAINHELDDLRTALAQSLTVLSNGGRLCVISFHSLEDRMVKQFIRTHSEGDAPPGLPVKESQITRRFRKIGGAIKASEQEIADNRRARSARLRIAERQA